MVGALLLVEEEDIQPWIYLPNVCLRFGLCQMDVCPWGCCYYSGVVVDFFCC